MNPERARGYVDFYRGVYRPVTPDMDVRRTSGLDYNLGWSAAKRDLARHERRQQEQSDRELQIGTYSAEQGKRLGLL